MSRFHLYYVYILTNRHHTVLYTGMTGHFRLRMRQHKLKQFPGFTARYNVDRLVYFEEYRTPRQAIVREKQLKAGSRQKKLNLINTFNPEWIDLAECLWKE